MGLQHIRSCRPWIPLSAGEMQPSSRTESSHCEGQRQNDCIEWQVCRTPKKAQVSHDGARVRLRQHLHIPLDNGVQAHALKDTRTRPFESLMRYISRQRRGRAAEGQARG